MSPNHLILCYPLLSCPQPSPASGSFPMSWLFTSGGQNIEVSASASVLPMNIQDWFPLELTGWISFKSLLFQQHSSKASILHCSAFFIVQLSHPYMTTVKTIALTRQTFVGKALLLSQLIELTLAGGRKKDRQSRTAFSVLSFYLFSTNSWGDSFVNSLLKPTQIFPQFFLE